MTRCTVNSEDPRHRRRGITALNRPSAPDEAGRTDNAVFTSPHAFSFTWCMQRNCPYICINFAACNPKDIDRCDCIAIAKRCCIAALLTMEICRGRISSATAAEYIDAETLEKQLRLRSVMASAGINFGEPQPRAVFIPTRVQNAHCTLLNSSQIRSFVSVFIGTEIHIIALLMERRGCRWLCSSCDIA